MNVKEIDKKFEETKEKIANAKKLMAEAKQFASLYESQAEEAAIAGDADTYMALKAKAEKQNALAYIQEKQIEKLGTAPIITKKETVDAWTDYARIYSEKMKNKLAKYAAAKKKLLEDYKELVDMQNEACSVREKLASYIGVNIIGATVDGGLDSLYPMEQHIPCIGKGVNAEAGMVSIAGSPIHDPDAVFYLSSLKLDGKDLCASEEAKSVNIIVGRRLTYYDGR